MKQFNCVYALRYIVHTMYTDSSSLIPILDIAPVVVYRMVVNVVPLKIFSIARDCVFIENKLRKKRYSLVMYMVGLR